MKKNHLLWLLMVAIIVPMLTMSCNKNKRSYDKDDDEETEKTEKTEKKKLIDGEYKLEQESLEIIFGDEMKNLKMEQGMNSDIDASFYFNDDDQLDCDFNMLISQYVPEISNTMKLEFVINAIGTWTHDKEDKTLTIKFKDVTVGDFHLKFAKENATTKEIRKQIGGEEALKKEMLKEINTEDFKKTTVFKVTRLQPDGFTVTIDGGDGQRIKFKKV